MANFDWTNFKIFDDTAAFGRERFQHTVDDFYNWLEILRSNMDPTTQQLTHNCGIPPASRAKVFELLNVFFPQRIPGR